MTVRANNHLLRPGINYRPLAISPLLPPVADGEKQPLSHALVGTSRWTGSNSSVETLLLIQSWLCECLNSHRQCSQILSSMSAQHSLKRHTRSIVIRQDDENATGFELSSILTMKMPTRLLDLVIGLEEDSVYLVISKEVGIAL
jgi:hypothetical protein